MFVIIVVVVLMLSMMLIDARAPVLGQPLSSRKAHLSSLKGRRPEAVQPTLEVAAGDGEPVQLQLDADGNPVQVVRLPTSSWRSPEQQALAEAHAAAQGQ